MITKTVPIAYTALAVHFYSCVAVHSNPAQWQNGLHQSQIHFGGTNN